VGARIVLQEIVVLLKRFEIQLARPRRQPFLQQILRRIGEPQSGAAIDRVAQQTEDIVRQVEMMVERKVEGGHSGKSEGRKQKAERVVALLPSDFCLLT